MFLRWTNGSNGDKENGYVYLVESSRRSKDGRPVHRIVSRVGPMTRLGFENLRTAWNATSREEQVVVWTAPPAEARRDKPSQNLVYLDLAVLVELWNGWSLGPILKGILPGGDSSMAPELVVEALVMQRLQEPDSKLAATRWLPTTALPELLGFSMAAFNNSRIHRVLEQLEEGTDSLMARLPLLYHERDGAFACLFLDVTDAWFVGRGPDLAVRGKSKEGIIQRKINIVLLCNENGYPIRWAVIQGNRNDGPAMQSILEKLSGVHWMGDAPIVMDRSMGRSAYLRAMHAAGVNFLTALVLPEFPKYAPTLPLTIPDGLDVCDESDAEVALAQLIERAKAAGMERVDDSMFVSDLGKRGLPQSGEEDEDDVVFRPCKESDVGIEALRTCRYLAEAVKTGQQKSLLAAGRAIGLSRATTNQYGRLRYLDEVIQQALLEGRGGKPSVETLIRLAKLKDQAEQKREFEKLVNCQEHGTRSQVKVKAPVSGEPRIQPEVRVLAYFNPNRFIDDRLKAHRTKQRIQAFAADLNQRLSRPQCRLTPVKIESLVEHRLRRDDLLSLYEIVVVEEEIPGRVRFQVNINLKQKEWLKIHRYDGFSVIVTHGNVSGSAARLCKLYREKDKIEKDFRIIKSVTELRPIYHRTDHKVIAHVTLCMLALLLERTLDRKLSGIASAETALETLHSCHLNRYATNKSKSAYCITELSKDQSNTLRKLRMTYLADDTYLSSRILPR